MGVMAFYKVWGGLTRDRYWNLIKKPWAFIRVPYYESYYFGVIGPGFLNQVPTLVLASHSSYDVAL